MKSEFTTLAEVLGKQLSFSAVIAYTIGNMSYSCQWLLLLDNENDPGGKGLVKASPGPHWLQHTRADPVVGT